MDKSISKESIVRAKESLEHIARAMNDVRVADDGDKLNALMEISYNLRRISELCRSSAKEMREESRTLREKVRVMQSDNPVATLQAAAD